MKSTILLTLSATAAAAPALVDENKLLVIQPSIADKINSNPTSTWKATADSKSRFAGSTIGDLRQMMGAKQVYENLPVIQHSQEVLDAAPASYDPRVSRPDCTGPILDQVSVLVVLQFLSQERHTR